MSEMENLTNEIAGVEMSESEMYEQRRIRMEKLAELKAKGKNPYEITKYNVTSVSTKIIENFEELENKTVSTLTLESKTEESFTLFENMISQFYQKLKISRLN